jgi:hypothetical protein
MTALSPRAAFLELLAAQTATIVTRTDDPALIKAERNRFLLLTDEDTGESKIEFKPVPEGISIAMALTDPDDTQFLSVLVRPESIDRLIAYLARHRGGELPLRRSVPAGTERPAYEAYGETPCGVVGAEGYYCEYIAGHGGTKHRALIGTVDEIEWPIGPTIAPASPEAS